MDQLTEKSPKTPAAQWFSDLATDGLPDGIRYEVIKMQDETRENAEFIVKP